MNKKYIFTGAILFGVSALAVAVYFATNGFDGRGVAFTSGGDSSDTSPAYKTLLPQGRTIDSLGGWKRVSPPESDPAYAYADTVDGAAITVSEQSVPKDFEDNVDGHVASLANSYNATDKIDAGGVAVYIGSSAKGPQSIIFTKNNLLILIKSYSKVSNESWTKYIQSLT